MRAHRKVHVNKRLRKFTHKGRSEACLMCETFTLILTKGMHIISAEAAGKIKDALATKAATIDVLLDPFGGLTETRVTTLALQHVVALTVNPTVDTMPANVSRIGARVRF